MEQKDQTKQPDSCCKPKDCDCGKPKDQLNSAEKETYSCC